MIDRYRTESDRVDADPVQLCLRLDTEESPQTLWCGASARSTSMTSRPIPAKLHAVAAPAGPPPTITVSIRFIAHVQSQNDTGTSADQPHRPRIPADAIRYCHSARVSERATDIRPSWMTIGCSDVTLPISPMKKYGTTCRCRS